MSLNLTFIVQGHTASGWESLGYTCLRTADHSFTVQVGVPRASFSYISTVNRDAGSSWFLVGTGVNCFSDARAIHASIRVHPGWWVGYLKLLPLG